MEFLTTSEAAEYLRLGERKLYELVTTGAIPCSKVTGKWLFPRQELDLWVLSGLARPAGMIASDPPPIVGGSQDDLLGMDVTRIRVRTCVAHRGHRARRRSPAARRGDRRGRPFPQNAISEGPAERRQYRGGARDAGPARCRAGGIRAARTGTAACPRQSETAQQPGRCSGLGRANGGQADPARARRCCSNCC